MICVYLFLAVFIGGNILFYFQHGMHPLHYVSIVLIAAMLERLWSNYRIKNKKVK